MCDIELGDANSFKPSDHDRGDNDHFATCARCVKLSVTSVKLFCDTFALRFRLKQRRSVTIFERLSDSQLVTMTKAAAEVFSMAIMMAVQFQIRGPLPFDALNLAAGKDV